jgi:hypothetical protein
MRVSIQEMIWLIAYVLAVGTVNTDTATPFGIINANGDALLVGDLKTFVFWKNRTSAFKFNGASPTDRFTGGIADVDGISAIACSSSESWLYNTNRTPFSPAGNWTRLSTINESRQCVMTSDGQYAILYPQISRLDLNGVSVNLGFKTTRNDKFVLLTAQNKFAVISSNGNWQLFGSNGSLGIFTHSFRASWQEQTRFAAGNRFMIKADSFRVELIALGDLSGNLTQVTRIPVNPCEDTEICQPGMSRIDDSWSISGYFGHYVGQGRDFARLPFPIASTGKGGVAFALQKSDGRFVYLANDDGDFGKLSAPIKTRFNPQRAPNKWFVWEKAGKGIPVPLARKTVGPNLVLRIHEGPLPDSIPNSWVAYEPEYELITDPEPFVVKLPYFRSNTTNSFSPLAWWSSNLGVSNAWSLVEAKKITPDIVKIAVVDTGALVSHPALQGGLYRNSKELENAQDDDDNGFVDDVVGYDFVLETAKMVDPYGHGTHVSGLLVGNDASTGVLAPASRNAQLLVLRSLDRSGKSTSIDLARALYYAIEQKVDVINCSWGGGGVTQALKDVFDAIYEAKILVFSSAGNDGANTDPPNRQPVPKLFPGVISVGATTQSGSLGSYSNYGKSTVRFLAPGDQILSTLKDGTFGELSGTSMASPVATSTFAWLLGVAKAKCRLNGCLKEELELRSIVLDVMCSTANVRGVENRSTCGIINTEAATRALLNREF